MQISQVLPQVSPTGNFTPARMLIEENFHSSRSELNINYSDQERSASLSISANSTYYESTYTVNGVLDNPAPVNTIDIMAIPSDGENTSEIESGTNKIIEDALQKYYELISKQVEYLLRQISEQHSRISDSPDPEQKIPQPNISNNSAFPGYAEYSQQTVIISNNLTINANIMDSDYFSPQKTAERIINFALSFYDGGDRQAFAAMVRDAVMKGFNEAMAAIGGSLPQETHETIEIVNRAIDDFARGNNINMSA